MERKNISWLNIYAIKYWKMQCIYTSKERHFTGGTLSLRAASFGIKAGRLNFTSSIITNKSIWRAIFRFNPLEPSVNISYLEWIIISKTFIWSNNALIWLKLSCTTHEIWNEISKIHGKGRNNMWQWNTKTVIAKAETKQGSGNPWPFWLMLTGK